MHVTKENWIRTSGLQSVYQNALLDFATKSGTGEKRKMGTTKEINETKKLKADKTRSRGARFTTFKAASNSMSKLCSVVFGGVRG